MPTQAQILRRIGSLRSDRGPLAAAAADFTELEGFLVEEGRLKKPPHGLKLVNTLNFDSRVVGIGEWRERT